MRDLVVRRLLELGDGTTALSLKQKSCCPHCGDGMAEADFERALHQAIDANEIRIQQDWSLAPATKAKDIDRG